MWLWGGVHSHLVLEYLYTKVVGVCAMYTKVVACVLCEE